MVSFERNVQRPETDVFHGTIHKEVSLVWPIGIPMSPTPHELVTKKSVRPIFRPRARTSTPAPSLVGATEPGIPSVKPSAPPRTPVFRAAPAQRPICHYATSTRPNAESIAGVLQATLVRAHTLASPTAGKARSAPSSVRAGAAASSPPQLAAIRASSLRRASARCQAMGVTGSVGTSKNGESRAA
jgi:hypothetical protein